jgi:hypothetical protein
MIGSVRRVDSVVGLFPKNLCLRKHSAIFCGRTLKNQKSMLRSCEPRKRREEIEIFPMRISGSNERTSGNGAIALWVHIQRLLRAVPECERWAEVRA